MPVVHEFVLAKERATLSFGVPICDEITIHHAMAPSLGADAAADAGGCGV